MTRNWWPCRVCGKNHKNPSSSSICAPCGQIERERRIEDETKEALEYEESPLGQFMSLTEGE